MCCARVVDHLGTAVCAHGTRRDTPIQRALRDVHAVANQGATNWDVQAVLYAREVLGLPPLRAALTMQRSVDPVLDPSGQPREFEGHDRGLKPCGQETTNGHET
jgi:hypothetical protein